MESVSDLAGSIVANYVMLPDELIATGLKVSSECVGSAWLIVGGVW